jgi:hypothetical protein
MSKANIYQERDGSWRVDLSDLIHRLNIMCRCLLLMTSATAGAVHGAADDPPIAAAMASLIKEVDALK